MCKIVHVIMVGTGFIAAASGVRADIASSAGGDQSAVHLYYVDHGQVTKADCPASTVLYDHATCAAVEGTISAAAALASLDEFFSRGLADLQTQRDQLVTKILRDDAQLDTYLSTATPSVPTADLTAQITAALAQRDQLVVDVKGLEDQVARIQAELEARPDVDLAGQLAAVAQQLATKRGALSQADSDLSTLRTRLVDAYTSLGQGADFQEVWHARQAAAGQLASVDGSIAEQLDETAVAKRCEQHLLDATFTWEIQNYRNGEGVGGAWEDLFANVLDQVYLGLATH